MSGVFVNGTPLMNKNLKPTVNRIGDVGYTLFSDNPGAGRKWTDGEVVSAELYQELYKELQKNPERYVTFAGFESEVTANGQCAKFGLDIENKKIRLPLIKDVYIKAGSEDYKNIFEKESLPNITGHINTSSQPSNNGGAFYASWSGGGVNGGTANLVHTQIQFDASRSSATYKNDASVETNHICLRFYVVVSEQNSRIGDGGSRNVGDVFFTTRMDNELGGAVGCDGTRYNLQNLNEGNNNVQELLTKNVLPYVSLEQHEASIIATGSCRAFGWDGGDTIAVPKINDVYIKAGTAETPDEFLEPALPNISGDFSVDVYGGGGTTGAFTRDGNYNVPNHGNWGFEGWRMHMNASLCNPIYKDDVDTVQPPSIRYRAMIQLFNSTTDDALATVTGVLTDVAKLKNMMGLISDNMLIRHKEATAEDPGWFNLYSNGFVEQGGELTPVGGQYTVQTTNLLIPMANDVYPATCGVLFPSTINVDTTVTATVAQKTTTTISFRKNWSSTNGKIVWRVTGYARPSEYSDDKWSLRPSAINGALWFPAAPLTNGTYSLGLVVQNGTPTPYWGQSFVRPPSAPERYLVRKKRATESDPTWYEIYSDGQCRQGGWLVSNVVDKNETVSLPIKFADTRYYINLTSNSSNNSFNTAQPNWVQARTTSTFNAHIDAHASDFTDWCAEGYADPTEYTPDRWGDDTDYSTISVMTGDPSPLRFKAWTNAAGDTVYTTEAIPSESDSTYSENTFEPLNDNVSAVGIKNNSRVINLTSDNSDSSMLDYSRVYVRNQGLDANGLPDLSTL